ncbi:MAG: hypothetical protein R3220_05740 [Balneolaceae bacterium]|nr:hypothetical protein [Balneolaceae bacterium]
MLKKWIDEIRKKPDLYKTNSWKYSISGNVIELSILPVYMKDRDTYRCAVIAVGQVLKALSETIEQHQSQFHIQSFPSIETPEIVASLRMDINSGTKNHSKPASKKISKEIDPESVVSAFARQYQLNLQVIDSPANKVEELKNLDFNTWFILYSTFNNPFTWLNVGYWKEAVENEFLKESQLSGYKIINLCDDELSEKPDLQVPKNKYLQSVIGLNAGVSTPE